MSVRLFNYITASINYLATASQIFVFHKNSIYIIAYISCVDRKLMLAYLRTTCSHDVYQALFWGHLNSLLKLC